jgi:hypothetical protein
MPALPLLVPDPSNPQLVIWQKTVICVVGICGAVLVAFEKQITKVRSLLFLTVPNQKIFSMA